MAAGASLANHPRDRGYRSLSFPNHELYTTTRARIIRGNGAMGRT
jgi:hypothetical protein